VYAAITGSGGHLGWFSGPLFGKAEARKSRWIHKPVSEFLQAATRDFEPVEYGIVVDREDGEDGEWTWVREAAHDVAGFKRVGWRVLSVGQLIEGAGDSGVLQGL